VRPGAQGISKADEDIIWWLLILRNCEFWMGFPGVLSHFWHCVQSLKDIIR
jgi:hypothetical protein